MSKFINYVVFFKFLNLLIILDNFFFIDLFCVWFYKIRSYFLLFMCESTSLLYAVTIHIPKFITNCLNYFLFTYFVFMFTKFKDIFYITFLRKSPIFLNLLIILYVIFHWSILCIISKNQRFILWHICENKLYVLIILVIIFTSYILCLIFQNPIFFIRHICKNSLLLYAVPFIFLNLK